MMDGKPSEAVQNHEAVQRVVADYTEWVFALARSEIQTARNKRSLLGVVQMANKLNSYVPWQVNRWGAATAKRFRETDPGFVVPEPHESRENENEGGEEEEDVVNLKKSQAESDAVAARDEKEEQQEEMILRKSMREIEIDDCD